MLEKQSKRCKEFKFRQSESKHTCLKDKALQENLSLGAYLIKAGLQKTDDRNDVPSPISRSIYVELGRIKHDIDLTVSKVDRVCDSGKSDIKYSLQALSQRLEKIQLLLVNI